MPDNDLYGVFREETSHGVGEVYRDTPSLGKLPRHKGKQFVTAHPSKGRLPDSYIDKTFKRLSEGHVYEDPSKTEKKILERGGTNVSTKPFVPSNPARKCTGPGGLDGCIGEMILMTEGTDEKRTKSSMTDEQKKRKIYTNPSQKGGYGFSHQARTIGGNPPGFMPDQYQPGRVIEKVMKKKARERISKPFVTSSKANKVFWENPYRTVPGPDRQRSSKQVLEGKMWKPSNPPRKGAPYCTISDIGRDYHPNPIPQPQFREKTEGGPVAFKPASGSKSRLSLKIVNPYERPARPPPNADFTILH